MQCGVARRETSMRSAVPARSPEQAARMRPAVLSLSSGRAVLEHLSAREVAQLARLWDKLDRAENPSPEDGEEARTLKKAWSIRLMSAFAGVCSRPLGPFPRRSGLKK